MHLWPEERLTGILRVSVRPYGCQDDVYPMTCHVF